MCSIHQMLAFGKLYFNGTNQPMRSPDKASGIKQEKQFSTGKKMGRSSRDRQSECKLSRSSLVELLILQLWVQLDLSVILVLTLPKHSLWRVPLKRPSVSQDGTWIMTPTFSRLAVKTQWSMLQQGRSLVLKLITFFFFSRVCVCVWVDLCFLFDFGHPNASLCPLARKKTTHRAI